MDQASPQPHSSSPKLRIVGSTQISEPDQRHEAAVAIIAAMHERIGGSADERGMALQWTHLVAWR